MSRADLLRMVLRQEYDTRTSARAQPRVDRKSTFGKLKGMIEKRGTRYKVKSESGKNLGGPYDSKEEAEKRLQQVEYFKHKKPGLATWAKRRR